MFRHKALMLLLVAVWMSAGCGQNKEPVDGGKGKGSGNENPSASAEGKQFLLGSEPAGAKGVIDLRKQSKDGDEVVVIGRVGGSTKPFTDGRSSFLIVDPSLKATEGCDTPWDFCELPNKEVAAARLNVKFVGPEGKTLQVGAKEMFGIKELSTVVVKGKVSRDDKDNVSVVASGIFVRKDKE